MSFIKGLGVFFLSGISILLLILLSLSFTFNSFLQPQVYFEAFEEAGVYDFVDQNLNNAPDMFIKIPEEGAKPLVEDLFSKFLAYMRSDTDTLDLKVKIDQEKLRNFFLDSIGNLRVCNQNQDPFDDEDPCLPRGMDMNQFLDAYLQSKGLTFFESDEVDLTTVYGIEQGSEGRKQLDEIRTSIKYAQFSSIFLIMIILVLWTLIFLLQRPNTHHTLRTVSITLIIPSIILFSLNSSLNNIGNLFTFPDPLLLSLVETVASILYNKILIYSLVIGISGLVLLIFSFFKPKNSKKVVTIK